jgi:hypothetical protein
MIRLFGADKTSVTRLLSLFPLAAHGRRAANTR